MNWLHDNLAGQSPSGILLFGLLLFYGLLISRWLSRRSKRIEKHKKKG